MGFQDRDYYQQRDDQRESYSSTPAWAADFTVIHYLIILNALVWFVCILTPVTFREDPVSHRLIPVEQAESRLPVARYTLDDYLALRANFVTEQPWNFWQLLTYGFVHAPVPIHLVFNMIGLWFFGREIEQRIGNREFLAFYLAAIVASGLAAVAYHNLGPSLRLPKANPMTVLVGASGAISAIVMCYGYMLGNRKVGMMFLPIGQYPAWAWVAAFVVFDLFSQFFSRDNVAYEAHLGGFAFGFIYCASKCNFTRWLPEKWFGAGNWFSPQPDVRIYDPDQDDSERESEFEASLGGDEGYAYHNEEADFNEKADRLLEKVHRDGANSLTPDEREHLEEYSRRIRLKRGR